MMRPASSPVAAHTGDAPPEAPIDGTSPPSATAALSTGPIDARATPARLSRVRHEHDASCEQRHQTGTAQRRFRHDQQPGGGQAEGTQRPCSVNRARTRRAT